MCSQIMVKVMFEVRGQVGLTNTNDLGNARRKECSLNVCDI